MRRPLRAGCVLALVAVSMSARLAAQDAPAPAPSLGGSPAATESPPAQPIGDAVKGIFGFLRGVIDNVLNPKVAELKRLVEGGKFEAAADYWVANQADLVKATDAAPLLAPIGKGLGEVLGAEAPGMLAALRAVTVPPADAKQAAGAAAGARPAAAASAEAHWSNAPGSWPEIRARLAAADALTQRAKAHPFYVAQPALLPAWVENVASEASAARGRIGEAMASAFVAYDHRNPQSFFDAYPVPPDARARAALSVRGAPLWMSAMLGGDEAQARAVAKTFAQHIRAPEAREMIAGAYAGVVARERKWEDTRSLQQIFQMMQALDEAGLDPAPAARGARIGVLRGLNAVGDGFQWRTSDRLVSTIEVRDVPQDALAAWAREVESVKPNQFYLLVDASRVGGGWQVGAVSERARQRQVGQREEPNPALARAREEVDDARRELANIEQMNRQAQAQAQQLAAQSRGSSTAAWGAVLGSSMSTASLISARDRVSRAERSLAETPRTIRTPVIQNYRTALASVEATRTREIVVYVVDGARGRFHRIDWLDNARRAEQIEFGVDPRDAGHAATEARNGTAREQLRRVGPSGGSPDAAEIWRRVLASAPAADGAPIGSLAQTIRDEHGRWSAAAEAERTRAQAAAQQLEERVLRIVQNQP